MFEEGATDMAQLALQQAAIEYQEFGPQDSPHAPYCSSTVSWSTAIVARGR